MRTTWSIYSGGRWNDQIAAEASFMIATDDALDTILLSSASIKQSFSNNLRKQLSRLALHHSPLCRLTIYFHSKVVVNEFSRREVELSVIVMDEVSDSMLWYFMLTSPEGDISPADLEEIASLIAHRLYAGKKSGTHKACL